MTSIKRKDVRNSTPRKTSKTAMLEKILDAVLQIKSTKPLYDRAITNHLGFLSLSGYMFQR